MWRTSRVASIIEVKDQVVFVNELLQIEQALRVGAPLSPHKYIKAGQPYRIIAGPLAGLEGIVVRTKNSIRLVLQIDMLGQATSVEVDTDMIEKLE